MVREPCPNVAAVRPYEHDAGHYHLKRQHLANQPRLEKEPPLLHEDVPRLWRFRVSLDEIVAGFVVFPPAFYCMLFKLCELYYLKCVSPPAQVP